MFNEKKLLGQVFTPNWIVDLILSKIEYAGTKILGSYVFEPGCGCGNFLIPIVEKYIKVAKQKKYTKIEIKNSLERYIYGIEIDKDVFDLCIKRLNQIAKNMIYMI